MRNRVAWGLAAMLAVALIGGIGVMLTHGIAVGAVEVHMRSTGRWTTGATRWIGCGPGLLSSTTTTTNLGFLAVDVSRTYYNKRTGE